jgi:predicted RNA binding protein YcfA (HicA-like mRNA interferase family)
MLASTIKLMRANELLKVLRKLGCVELRQVGSHVRVQCRECFSTVPVHAGYDVPKGTLRAIERDLEPCLGKGWLGRRR